MRQGLALDWQVAKGIIMMTLKIFFILTILTGLFGDKGIAVGSSVFLFNDISESAITEDIDVRDSLNRIIKNPSATSQLRGLFVITLYQMLMVRELNSVKNVKVSVERALVDFSTFKPFCHKTIIVDMAHDVFAINKFEKIIVKLVLLLIIPMAHLIGVLSEKYRQPPAVEQTLEVLRC